MWAQETRGWVDKSLFQGGTRNPNLSQALDPFPLLPLLSGFLWSASLPAQTKQFHVSNSTTGHGIKTVFNIVESLRTFCQGLMEGPGHGLGHSLIFTLRQENNYCSGLPRSPVCGD